MSGGTPDLSGAAELARAVAEHLRYYRALGITDLQVTGGAGEGERPSLSRVRAELGDCTRCPLCRTRRQIVFGTGHDQAELVFVGEGPGEEEDRQGEPFVGKAGQLLTRMIEAMGLTRAQVYIANIVKCRPPGNRLPTPVEIATCLPFLEAQLAAIRPRVICTLGAVATQALLKTTVKISQLRGRFHDYPRLGSDGSPIRVLPTYHPAYLLRNPAEKKVVWADLQMVLHALGRDQRPLP